MINLLNTDILLNSACNSEEFFHANVRIIAYSLLLLCILAYEKTIFALLKGKRLQHTDILNNAKDSGIQFVYNALSAILRDKDIDEENEPKILKQNFLKFIQDNPPEAKHITLSDWKTYESN